jgi:hypothetical protein
MRRDYEDKARQSVSTQKPAQPAPRTTTAPPTPPVDPRPSEREEAEEGQAPRKSDAELAEERAKALEEGQQSQEGGQQPPLADAEAKPAP